LFKKVPVIGGLGHSGFWLRSR